MRDITSLIDYMSEHKITIVATVIGLFVGAAAGVVAYYHGWLG